MTGEHGGCCCNHNYQHDDNDHHDHHDHAVHAGPVAPVAEPASCCGGAHDQDTSRSNYAHAEPRTPVRSS